MALVWTPSPTGFVKPSSSHPDRVGRDGFLGLRFQQRAGRTTLAQCRFKLPLQALTPAVLADGTTYLMLLNPTGGVVGGDFLLTQIVQEADTRVCLTTPSATRVYRTGTQAAVQETHIAVGERARLEYLPDHLIPYRDSEFRQSLQVEMETGSSALFWDALAAGRVARGERWEFHEVDSRIEISLRGQTAFLNRTRIRPAEVNPKRLGFSEGFNYMATLVIVADQLDVWKETAAAMNAELKKIPQVHAGATMLAASGCVVKLLARSASDLSAAQKALWGRARRMIFRSLAVDLRKY